MSLLEHDVGSPADYASVDYKGEVYRGKLIIAEPNNSALVGDCGVRACYMAIQSAINKYCMDNNKEVITLSFEDLKAHCDDGISIKAILNILQSKGIVEERSYVKGRRVVPCLIYTMSEVLWSFPAEYPESEAAVRHTLLRCGPAVVGVFEMRRGYDLKGERVHSQESYLRADDNNLDAKPITRPRPFVDRSGKAPELLDPYGNKHKISDGTTLLANFEESHAVILVASPDIPRSKAETELNTKNLYWYKNTWDNKWGKYDNGCQEIDIKLLNEAYCITSIVKRMSNETQGKQLHFLSPKKKLSGTTVMGTLDGGFGMDGLFEALKKPRLRAI